MKKNSLILLLALLNTFIFIVPDSAARQGQISPYILHAILGEVIDAQENVRFNILGDIRGLTAARMYSRGVNEFRLHLLRNTDEGAQILILTLASADIAELSTSIARRIIAVQTEATAVAVPLYPIAESEWVERSRLKELVLYDGSKLVGTFEQAEGDTLIVQSAAGLHIPIPDLIIERVNDLRGEIRQGQLLRNDPNSSRLLFAPTGRRLSAGSGYFADYFIFFPTIAYGLADFLSLSGGMSIVPGAKRQLLYVAPKITVGLSPKVGFGTGILYLDIPEEEDDLNLGYAVTTIGSSRGGVTLGAGLPLETETGQDFILLIGGDVQISNSAKLLTENWIFTGEDNFTIFSAAVRFFGERLAVDLALLTTEEAFKGDIGFPFLPWVDFSVFFGK